MSGAKTHGDLTEEDKQLMVQSKIATATAWGKSPKEHHVVLDHMQNGVITTKKDLTDITHANKAYKVSIEGNGNGVMKPAADHSHSPETVAAGLGYMPPGTEPQREKAAYHLSAALGLTNHVPPTATRSHEGQVVSMQQWKEDCVTPLDHAIETGANMDKGWYGMLLSAIPETHKKEVMNKLKEIGTLDIIMNNTDRHLNNIMLAKGGTDVFPIDHGVAFCSGMNGCRNAVLEGHGKLGHKFTIPDTLKTKIDNMSFGDYKRSLKDSGIADYEVAQTFLRSRYVSFLQDSEGEIDPDKFMTTLSNSSGSREVPFVGPKMTIKDMELYAHRKQRGELPNQLFESWAKKYLNEASSDESHKDFNAAKEIEGIGIFMGPGFAQDSRKYRFNEEHRKHENTIVPKDPPKKLYQHKTKQEPVEYAATMKDRRAKPR